MKHRRGVFDGWWHGWHGVHSDSDGNPNVFTLKRNDDGLWLGDNWANPGNRWNPANELVFRFRNSLHFPPLLEAGAAGFLIITMGAGDIYKVAQQIAD